MAEENVPARNVGPWGRRIIHGVVKVTMLVLIWLVAVTGSMYGETYRQLELKLPRVCQWVIDASAVIDRPAVLICGGVLGLALVVLGHFGRFDRALVPLIIVDAVLIFALLAVYLFVLPGPLKEMQKAPGP